ncbi:MAG: hypothetical protein RBT87_07660 [bacterium]|jgi:hypothetical protein|nr:hypothetical protein [bacterium]
MVDLKDSGTMENEMIALVSSGVVYTFADIQKLYNENRNKFPAYNRSFKKFLRKLLELGLAERHILDEEGYQKKTVFTFGDFDSYECISKINKNAYFSHHTALFMNSMTEQIPKTAYVSYELSQTKITVTRPELKQENIDKVFSAPPREARYYLFNRRQVILHASKFNGYTGVIKNSNGTFFQTDPERSLIDSVVRPYFSGGIFNVLNVFIENRERYSISKIVNYLKALNYIYPYHQAIGFLLEKAGFPEKDLALFENMGIKHKFYIDYEISDRSLSKRWNLIYPSAFDE